MSFSAHYHDPTGNYCVNDTGADNPSHPPHHEAQPHSTPLENSLCLLLPPLQQSTNGEPSAHSILAPIPQTPNPFNTHHHFPLGNHHANDTGTGAPSYPFQHHEAPPHLASLEYHSRLPFPPLQQAANGEPFSHSISPALPPISQTLNPFDLPNPSPAHGMNQRKASRAQQVRDRYTNSQRPRVALAVNLRSC